MAKGSEHLLASNVEVFDGLWESQRTLGIFSTATVDGVSTTIGCTAYNLGGYDGKSHPMLYRV